MGWGGYYGYPYRYWKRDAEAAPTAAAAPAADADASPESWYYGYYGHPYRWGGYYRGYYGYGYPYRYWWKRSAEEQQPEAQHVVKRSADADADASLNLTTTDTTAIPTDGAVTTEDITVTDTPDTTGDKSLS